MRQTQTCHRCGLESVLEAQFWRGRCPRCQPTRYSTRAGLFIIGTTLLCGLLIVAVEILGLADVALWGSPVLLGYLATHPLRTLLHELMHYASARIAGWTVARVQVGGDPAWFEFGSTTRWVVGRRLLTGGGSCHALPPSTLSRRAAIAYLVTPSAMHLLVAVEAVMVPVGGFARRALLAFALANVVDAVLNLWPRTLATGQRTDGAHLVELIRNPERSLPEWRATRLLKEAVARASDGDMPEANKLIEQASDLGANPLAVALLRFACAETELDDEDVEAIASVPEMSGGHRGHGAESYVRGSMWMQIDRAEKAIEVAEQEYEQATSEVNKARWAASLALPLLLADRDADSISRARELATFAFRRVPWESYVATAYGAALVESGSYADGLRVLDEADKRGHAEDRDTWRAVALDSMGRGDDARACADRVKASAVWAACKRRVKAL